jgi:hypothetical protein
LVDKRTKYEEVRDKIDSKEAENPIDLSLFRLFNNITLT